MRKGLRIETCLVLDTAHAEYADCNRTIGIIKNYMYLHLTVGENEAVYESAISKRYRRSLRSTDEGCDTSWRFDDGHGW